MPLLSEASKPELLKAVKDRPQAESEMRERGDRVLLWDPDGCSLQEHILVVAHSDQR